MPLLKTFSLSSPHVGSRMVDTFPYTLQASGLLVEIYQQADRRIMSASQHIFLNGASCQFGPFESGDLLWSEQIAAFWAEQSREKARKQELFLGSFQTTSNHVLLFRLPSKVCQDNLRAIEAIVATTDVPGSLVYIDGSSTIYMDSKSINGILAVMKTAKQKGRSLFLYQPSEKLLTYLKLANIEKLVPLHKSHDVLIDQLINEGGKERTMVIRGEDDVTFTVEEEKRVVVGRADGKSNLRLDDRYVSRCHAVLLATSNLLYLVDCGSKNHTFLNNEPVDPYRLYVVEAGDGLRFGKTVEFQATIR